MKISAETGAQIAQCALACAYGCAMWLHYPPTENHKERLLAALIAGFGGVWVTMFVYVLARFGWRSARSMRMGD